MSNQAGVDRAWRVMLVGVDVPVLVWRGKI
jgi:hypothetical protein